MKHKIHIDNYSGEPLILYLGNQASPEPEMTIQLGKQEGKDIYLEEGCNRISINKGFTKEE